MSVECAESGDEWTCSPGLKGRGLCKNHYERYLRENRIGQYAWLREKGSPCLECGAPSVNAGLCHVHWADEFLDTSNDGCAFNLCGKPVFSRFMCKRHYSIYISGKKLHPLPLLCAVETCGNKASRKFNAILCYFHVQQKWRYGLDDEELIAVMMPGVCTNVGCDSTLQLSIDHDHSCCPGVPACGKCVRGLLCRNCNSALGLARENPRVLQGLISYLEHWG